MVSFLVLQSTSLRGTERWFRGNTHPHSSLSDGDIDLNSAVSWYNEHGYNFILLSDHNLTADMSLVTIPLRNDFIPIQANEITSNVHLTAMGITAGALFNGSFVLNVENTLTSTHFGEIFEAEPKTFKFSYYCCPVKVQRT